MEQKIITLGVLAGAYRGQRTDLKKMLTHSIEAKFDGGGNGLSLCRRISADHLVDSAGMSGNEDQPPTCTTCLRRDPRFNSDSQQRV